MKARFGRAAKRGLKILKVNDELARGVLNRLDTVADLVHDGLGHGTPGAAPFHEPPERVAGHAEVLGCLAPSRLLIMNTHVGPGPLSRCAAPTSWCHSARAFVAPRRSINCPARHCAGGGFEIRERDQEAEA